MECQKGCVVASVTYEDDEEEQTEADDKAAGVSQCYWHFGQ